MFIEYLYEDTLTQGPTFYPLDHWLVDIEDTYINHLFIGSEDDWNTFTGFLTANNITIEPENWDIFPELDSDVIRYFSTLQGNLFFFSRTEYPDKHMSKYNKEISYEL